jgi:hypothetical protein
MRGPSVAIKVDARQRRFPADHVHESGNDVFTVLTEFF